MSITLKYKVTPYLSEQWSRFKRKDDTKNANKGHSTFDHGVQPIVPTSLTAEQLQSIHFYYSS